MSKYYRKLCIVLVLIGVMNILFSEESYAKAPEVELIVNPDRIEIPINFESITLIADSSDSNLKFQWTHEGVGKLEGAVTEPAVIYIPPKDLDRESAQAIVSVKVSNEKGEQTTKSRVFKIINSSASPSPSIPNKPTPISSEPIVPNKGQLIFNEDFETGYDEGFESGYEHFEPDDEGNLKTLETGKDYSKKKGESIIKVVDCRPYGRDGKCVEISRTRQGGAYLYIILRNYSGTLWFESMIRAENVAIGKEYYECGKFGVAVLPKSVSYKWEGENGYRWHDILFDGTFGWKRYIIDDVHVEKHEAVKLTISLQNTTGTIYLDDLKIYYLPK